MKMDKMNFEEDDIFGFDGDFDENMDSNDKEDEEENEYKNEGRDVQMLLFSATMPGWICSLTDKHMDDPLFLDAVNPDEVSAIMTCPFSIFTPLGDSEMYEYLLLL